MLTKDNYEACLLGIKEQELPKTFRDGILVVRKLGLRYLWIDALCIRQMDEDDLKYELRRMGSIFEQARLVIAASDTENCEDGFIRNHNPLFTNPCRLDQDARVPYVLSTVCSGNFTLRQQHLDTRGWVFQERFLAPRTVRFSHTHVQWECRERWVCEAQHIRPCHRGRYQIKKEFLRLLSLPVTPSEHRDNAFSILWRGLLEEYSATKLTKEQDFLPAISGLIRVLEDRINMRQSFGIWHNLLPQELLWRRNAFLPIGRRVVDRAPSWSWASLQGQILDNTFTRAAESARAPIAEVIQLPERTAAEDPHYAAENPYPYLLTLKCPVRKGLLMLTPKAVHRRGWGQPKEVRLLPLEEAEGKEPTMMILPDYSFYDLSDGCPVTIALIATTAIQANPHSPLCLVLTAHGKNHMWYRRIGYADALVSRSEWSGWSEDGWYKEFDGIDFLALDYFPAGTPVEEICIV
jgi:Heterokaryon incompatibility protein (HET)